MNRKNGVYFYNRNMTYHSKLNVTDIVNQAWDMIDQEGYNNFSMHQLAQRFDVKTASLYRYFKRGSLIAAVNEKSLSLLYQQIQTALSQPLVSQKEKILVMARAYRQFAAAHPHCYLLLFDANYLSFSETVSASFFIYDGADIQLSPAEDPEVALRGLHAILYGYLILEILFEDQWQESDQSHQLDQVLETYLHYYEV